MDKEITSLVLTRFNLQKIDGGAALRTWQNVQCLAKMGPVDVVSIGAEIPDGPVIGIRRYLTIERPAEKMRSLQGGSFLKRLQMLLFSGHPMLESLYMPEAVERLNRELKEEYDVAVLEELWLMRYLDCLKRKAKVTVFDAHNVESVLLSDLDGAHAGGQKAISSIKRRILKRKLYQAEVGAARDSDRVWVCSDVDAEAFRSFPGPIRADVVPNSIDLSRYQNLTRVPESDDWSEKPITLMYLGMYSYFPNEEAALILINEVMPAIRKRGRKVQLNLVGKGPTPAMVKAAEGNDDILITGKVPSIEPFLNEACVITLPLRLGSGTRLKILESFASSRPVVSSAKGVEGIDGKDGIHLLIRESAEEFAEAAIRIWDDPSLREKLCTNAKNLVRDGYSFESAGKLISKSLRG